MIHNRRDLSDIARLGGIPLRMDCLIRSAGLSQAEPDDLSRIDTVIDLRTQTEAAQLPDRTADWISYYHLPLFDAEAAGITREGVLTSVPEMKYLYRFMLEDEHCRRSLLDVLQLIFAHDYSKGAVLWHCTAGKDRCGIVTALVFLALGLDRELIMMDYLLSNAVCEQEGEEVYRKLLQAGQPEPIALAIREAYLAKPEYLQEALDAFDRNPLEFPDLDNFRQAVLFS